MSAQRFIAANATDALRRIKAELGGDVWNLFPANP